MRYQTITAWANVHLRIDDAEALWHASQQSLHVGTPSFGLHASAAAISGCDCHVSPCNSVHTYMQNASRGNQLRGARRDGRQAASTNRAAGMPQFH
ncbi:hypothetical protein FALBO_16113, partial [Fusarium albosuccineum]